MAQAVLYPADDLVATLHRRILVMDGHLDLATGFGEGAQRADLDGPGQFDLAKIQQGGVAGVCLCLSAPLARSTPAGIASGQAIQAAKLAAIRAMAADFPDRVAIVRSPQAFRETAASGRLAVVLTLQNAAPFDGDLEEITRWAEAGVQMIALAFIGNNAFTDSSRPYPFAGAFHHDGLSALGRQAVQQMNRLGVLVDVSQMSDAALADTLKVTRRPVVASHSAPRALHQTRRNLADDSLRAIAEAGGLVNLVGFANYLAPTDLNVQDQLRALWMRYGLTDCQKMDDAIFHPDTAKWDDAVFWEFLHEFHVILDLDNPHASVDQFVDAVAYTVDLIGLDHVGLSSDFNHGGGLTGWRHIGETHNVTAALLRRGFHAEEIAKLWGENFLAVWDGVKAGSLAA